MTASPAGHVTALTGLRGISIALVLLAHAHLPHLGVGLFGVDVFFVLSGFLITNVLVGLAPFGARRWGFFLGRRAARLLPTLAVTLVALAAWVLLGDVERGGQCLALAATHTMDLPVGSATRCRGPFHITWSLAAEEQFYLLWPLAVVGLTRLPARQAAAVCFSSYAGLWAVAYVVAHVDSDTAGWLNYSPAGRPTALLLGAALAFLVPLRGPRPEVDEGAARLALPLFAGGFAVAGVLLAVGSPPRQVLLGPLVAVPATLLVAVLVLVPTGFSAAVCRQRWLVWLGEVSYCLYLVHVLALHVAREVTGDDALLTNAAGVAAALLAGWALHHGVEQPVRRRGYAWLRAREETAPASVPTPTLVG